MEISGNFKLFLPVLNYLLRIKNKLYFYSYLYKSVPDLFILLSILTVNNSIGDRIIVNFVVNVVSQTEYYNH